MLCGAAHKRFTQQRGHRGGQGGLRASIPSHMTRMFAAALPAQASAFAAEVRPVKLSFGQQRAICLTSEQVLTDIITSIYKHWPILPWPALMSELQLLLLQSSQWTVLFVQWAHHQVCSTVYHKQGESYSKCGWYQKQIVRNSLL